MNLYRKALDVYIVCAGGHETDTCFTYDNWELIILYLKKMFKINLRMKHLLLVIFQYMYVLLYFLKVYIYRIDVNLLIL